MERDEFDEYLKNQFQSFEVQPPASVFAEFKRKRHNRNLPKSFLMIFVLIFPFSATQFGASQFQQFLRKEGNQEELFKHTISRKIVSNKFENQAVIRQKTTTIQTVPVYNNPEYEVLNQKPIQVLGDLIPNTKLKDLVQQEKPPIIKSKINQDFLPSIDSLNLAINNIPPTDSVLILPTKSIEIKPKKETKPWSVSLGYQLILYNSIGSNNHLSAIRFGDTNTLNPQFANLSQKVSIGLSRKISQRLSINLAFNYLTVCFANIQSLENANLHSDNASLNVTDNEKKIQSFKMLFDESYHFYSIPISVSYQIQKGKWAIVPEMGLQYTRFWFTKTILANVANQKVNNLSKINDVNSERFNRNLLGAKVGLKAQYSWNRLLGGYIGFNFEHNFNSHFNPNYYLGNKPNLFGIETGIKVNF